MGRGCARDVRDGGPAARAHRSRRDDAHVDRKERSVRGVMDENERGTVAVCADDAVWVGDAVGHR